MFKRMAKPTTEKENTKERTMIKMWVYIVTFEGAYGMQIAEVFTNRQAAIEYIAKQDKFYFYEIIEKFAI